MKRILSSILAIASAAALTVKLARHLTRDRVGPSDPEPVTAPAVVVTQATSTPHPTVGTRTLHWGQVEAADYHQYLSNLRSIGCPERTIADILATDIHALYEAKRQAPPAVEEDADEDPSRLRPQPDPRSRAIALWGEEEQVIRALLGSPPGWWQNLASSVLPSSTTSRGSTRHEPQFVKGEVSRNSPGLPTGVAGSPPVVGISTPDPTRPAPPVFPDSLLPRAGALSEWHRKTEDARRDLRARRDTLGASSELLAEEVQLEAASAAELDLLLSPTEREEYDYHYSPGAQDLRNRLQDVVIGESEMRSLVKIRNELDRSVSGIELSGEAFLAALESNQSEMARTLGPEKWEEAMVRGDFERVPGVGDLERVDRRETPEPEMP